jgi:leucyl aminopeptidase (aminopeptidase T)
MAQNTERPFSYPPGQLPPLPGNYEPPSIKTEIHPMLEFPFNEELKPAMETTADQVLNYSLEIQAGETVLIRLSEGEYSHQFCEIIKKKIKERGAKALVQIMLPSMNNNIGADSHIMENVSRGRDNYALPLGVNDSENDQDQATAFFHHGPGSDDAHFLAQADKLLIIRTRVGDTGKYEIDPQLKSEVAQMSKTLTDWRLDTTSNQHPRLKKWCLIVPPTPEAPRPEGMSAQEFAKLYFEACSLDWEEVEKAQKVLIELLSGKQEIKINVPAPEGLGSEWETNITFETSDQIFANSVARQNMPGAEVFGAPTIHTLPDGSKKGTLNGVFAVPFPVWFINRVLPNLRLTFKDGKVADSHTDAKAEDKAFFEKTIATDEGASIIGEVGFGTNKNIDVPPPDTMLAEKAFGIHLALGSSHPQKTYFNETVQIDNGNTSEIHVDIPRLMLPQFGGGTIIVDGETIFDNGQYLDPRLAVLNPETA